MIHDLPVQYARTKRQFEDVLTAVYPSHVLYTGAAHGMADAWVELWLIEEQLMWLGRS